MITGKTRIHVLIGSPIRQVLAPGLLSQKMAEAGDDAALVPMQIEPQDIDISLPALMRMPNIDSILVTLPHKFAAFRHCASTSNRARVLGAINAMRRTAAGEWFGDNFDGAGFVAGLVAAGHQVKGRRVYMAGAGAAGSSIAVALLEAGSAFLGVHDVHPESEDRLLALLDRHYPGRSGYGGTSLAGYETIVNASSAGLSDDDSLPVDVDQLTPNMVLGDVITDPLPTRLVREARSRGCAACDGKDMLNGQLQLLFDFMLGRDELSPNLDTHEPD